MTIEVNGNEMPIGPLPVTRDWTVHSFYLERKSLNYGINKISIEWPYYTMPTFNPNPSGAVEFLNSIFPVVAEISSFEIVKGVKEVECNMTYSRSQTEKQIVKG